MHLSDEEATERDRRFREANKEGGANPDRVVDKLSYSYSSVLLCSRVRSFLLGPFRIFCSGLIARRTHWSAGKSYGTARIRRYENFMSLDGVQFSNQSPDYALTTECIRTLVVKACA